MKLWNNLELTNPEFLWLFLLIPLLAIWYFFVRKKDKATLTISNTKGFKGSSLLAKLKPLLYVLRLLTLSALILAMTRPRNVEVSKKTKTTSGIDIVMAIDISASMLAKDLRPNRLEALKDVAKYFGAADIVVQPYKTATQSGITQIAYHFEKPMIVTDVGGLKEIVPEGKVGFVVKPKAEELAKAVVKFYESDIDFQKHIKEEKKKYAWSRMLEKIEHLMS